MIKDFLKNKKAVLFDLDGTLVDSMWMWPQIDVEFLGRFGYDCPGDLERAVEGMSFSETAAYFKERFSLPMTLEEIKECWSQMAMDKYRTQVPLKPGALEFLRYCKDRGIATGIATSNGRAHCRRSHRGSADRRVFPGGGHRLRGGKGKAGAGYLSGGGETPPRWLPEDCLVFEDVPAGILAGKRAGMTVLAVEDDFSRELSGEKKALADGYICDYSELL